MKQSAEVQSAMEFFATAHSFPEGCHAYKNEVYFCRQISMRFTAHTQGAFSQRSCGESPGAKFLRVSADCRTPVRGQAVKQSAEMQTALEFFATAVML